MAMKRFEVLVPPDMRRGMDVMARKLGLIDASAWVRLVLAEKLTRALGDSWKDHPEGDHENVVGDQGA